MIVQRADVLPRVKSVLLTLVLATALAACAPPLAAEPPPKVAEALSAAAPAVAVATPTAPARKPRATPTARPRPSPTTGPSSTPAPTLAPTPTLAPVGGEQRTKLFNQIWTLVAERYVYEDIRGLDWNAVRDELAPRIAAAEDPERFYTLLAEMIERLGDDHSRFESPQEVLAEQRRYEGTLSYGGIGATVRTVAEGGLITGLARNGPAALAGLQPRDLILLVGNIPFTDTAAFGPGGPISAIQGKPGTSLTLTVRTPGRAPRRVTLRRAIIPGDAFRNVDLSLLPNTRVALLRIDTFYAQDVDRLVREQLEQLVAEEPLEGLIIDVRANGGGRVDLMLQTVGLFVDGGVIGSSASRKSNALLVAPANKTIPELEGRPIAVLVGPDTVSAAEMFAAGMQALGRATLVGLPSAGNTESMRPHDFVDGSRLWLAELSFRLPDGSMIEGSGVQPDRRIEVAWWRFRPEDDPQVKAALRVLGL